MSDSRASKRSKSNHTVPHASGYPQSIFISPPDSSLVCSICFCILKDAKRCDNEHCYCHDCIKQWTQNNCPTCRIDITNLKDSRYSNAWVESLSIRCPNLDLTNNSNNSSSNTSLLTCNWTGTVSAINTHKAE